MLIVRVAIFQQIKVECLKSDLDLSSSNDYVFFLCPNCINTININLNYETQLYRQQSQIHQSSQIKQLIFKYLNNIQQIINFKMSSGHKHEQHEHVHGENCNHDHEEHHESSSDDEAGTDPTKKSNRGEKKFKKAMTKLGMKPVTGINRVTIRKGKAFLISIDNPEVLKSPGAENTYVVFGKPNMDDMNTRLGKDEIKNFQPATKVEEKAPETTVTATEDKNITGQTENTQDLSEEGLTAENIKMVMEYTKCTRAVAIKTLRESNDDSVNAIMKLTG